MIRFYSGMMLWLVLCVGVASASDFDQFNQSITALSTSPTSTTYWSSSGGRIEVLQTGPNKSYFISSDRSGRTTATGTLYSTPASAPVSAPLDLAPPPPTWSLFRDPFENPLGLDRRGSP